MTMHLASRPANIIRQPRLRGWRGVPLLVILTAALPAMAIGVGGQTMALACLRFQLAEVCDERVSGSEAWTVYVFKPHFRIE